MRKGGSCVRNMKQRREQLEAVRARLEEEKNCQVIMRQNRDDFEKSIVVRSASSVSGGGGSFCAILESCGTIVVE